MIRWIVQPLMILAACAFQLSGTEAIAFLGARPNVVLVMVVAWSLIGGLRNGLLWALLGGLILDFYTAAPFGVLTSLMVLSCIAVAAGSRGLEIHSLFPPLVIGFVTTLAFDTLGLIVFQSVGRPVDWGTYFFPVILPEAIYNGLLAGAVYLPLLWFHRRLDLLELR